MGTAIIGLCSILCVLIPSSMFAQCWNGSEPECTCTTAPVLCTIDELDGYAFSMTSYQHPWDGPSPLCPPQTGTVPNNPTWFAFKAWCTTLTLHVTVSNCQMFQPPWQGVQIAIYSSCNPYIPVACNTASSDCNTDPKILTMNNLVIGATYYFLIDGCAGAYCDVEIDVLGVCGEPIIEEWSMPISGPASICIGSSETHFAEVLDGATDYHWYIDGVLITQGPGLTSFVHTWNTAGTFQVCVDASNDPCIPESNPPLPNCITVNVFDAAAGTIDASPTPVCPEESVTITASGFNIAPGYEQYILIVDASGVIISATPGGNAVFSHPMCAGFTAYSYNYHPSGGNGPPVVGATINSLMCNTSCCELEPVTFAFEDNIAPVLLNTPPDLDINCYDLLPAMVDLDWTDNCSPPGVSQGIESGNASLCEGGVLTRSWMATDQCNNSTQHVQIITIDPMAQPAFVDAPPDITVDCSNIPSSASDLEVSNMGVGGCMIVASVSAMQNGDAGACGGAFAFIWEYTDPCDRTITHVQNVTIVPLAEAQFIDVPADITVVCHEIPTSAPALSFSNGGSGPCEISGSVEADISGSANICGGMIFYNWTYTDQCERQITATQSITVLPVPQAEFIDPPEDLIIPCADVPGQIPALFYTNGLDGDCLIEGSIDPEVTSNLSTCGGLISALWRFEDACGRVLAHTQLITVLPPSPPEWINAPQDTFVDCSDLSTDIPDLSITNDEFGICSIKGVVQGTQPVYDLCQGMIVRQWQHTDPCGNTIEHVQTITTSPPPPILFIDPPVDITVQCNEVPSEIPALAYSNNASGPCEVSGVIAGQQNGGFSPCGGLLTRIWQVTDPCGILYAFTQNITVLPAPPPAFTTLPEDITITCAEVPANPPPLGYTNNQMGQCAITGSVPASVTGSYNSCGGNLVYTWSFTDNCGNTIVHHQQITVLPAPPPAFNTLPEDITIDCSEVQMTPPSISYSNNQTGSCSIAGTVTATTNGTYDACGGTLIYTWTYTDPCGTTISHTQELVIDPADDPVWIDPPADLTLDCDDEYTSPDALFYSNDGDNDCAVTGSVTPIVSFENLIYTHIWSYTHPCTGATITYEQTVTTVPVPVLVIDPVLYTICHGDEFDLSNIFAEDINNTSITITYHTGTPASVSNALASPEVSPGVGIHDYYLLATNVAGCTDETQFTLIVDPLPYAGPDQSLAVCQTETVNFNNLLSPFADAGGFWIDKDNSGVNLFNPSSVAFNNVDPGTYVFQYVIAINQCPADTSDLVITVTGPPAYTIDSVYCTMANTTYTVAISGMNIGATSAHGTIVTVPGGIEIQDIPFDQPVTFDIYDLNAFCFYTVNINPPNCDCPGVPPPVSSGNMTACQGDAIPALNVTVPQGYAAHWYSAPTGGTLLAANSTSYLPPDSLSGTFVYYVEAESEEFPGCVSNVRTPVTLIIHSLPAVNDIVLQFCDSDETGSMNFDLFDWRMQITGNPAHTVTFHDNSADAISGINVLAMPVGVQYGTTAYFAAITSTNACVSIAEVTIVLHALPDFDIDRTHESCSGAGDGAVTITGLDSMQSYSVLFEANVYTDQFVFTDLDAAAYSVSITSIQTGCTQTDSFTIDPGLTLTVSTPVLTCDDNGTDTDPDDDFYTIGVSVSASGNTSIYALWADGVMQGYFNYGTVAEFTVPAQNIPVTIMVIDTMYGCSQTLMTEPLTTCSSTCDLFVDILIQTCDDNGTPVDPSDDFHSITINVSAVNGSATDQYFVVIDGSTEYIFTYGMSETFTLPVSQVMPVIVLQDADDVQCFINLTLSPLTGCSNQCTIEFLNTEYICSDNDTPDDTSDDFYTIQFVGSVMNPGPSGMIVVEVDGNVVQTVTQGTLVTLILPADGTTHTMTISDVDDPDCQAQWTTPVLSPCSVLCMITVDALDIVCDDSGTPLDPTDDNYMISWTASAVFGAANNMYTILVDGTPSGNGIYGAQASLSLPADGQAHTLTLQDDDNILCTVMIPLPDLIHCSNACELSVTILDIYCDNQDTNQTEDDDVYFAVAIVEGVNVSSGQWTVVDQAFSGIIGDSVTLGPFMIQAGDVTLVFSAVDAVCASSVVLNAPPPCSACEQMIDAGPDVHLDCGSPSAVLAISSSSPGQYTWIDPAGGITQAQAITVSIAGQYAATVSFPDGCVFSDTVIVTSDPLLPAVWAGPDQFLSCEITEVLLQAEIITSSGMVSYAWTNSMGEILSTTEDLIVNQPGIYFVRIFDEGVGCWSGQDAVEVLDITNEPSAIIYASPGSLLSCKIEFIELSHDNEPNVQYTWVALGLAYSDNVLTIYEGGSISLIALDTITRCESIDSITVETAIDYPVIRVDDYPPLSCDTPVAELNASSSIPSVGGTFIWTNAAGDTISASSMVNVTLAGVYILELSDPDNGCTSTDTLLVEDLTRFPLLTVPDDVMLPCDELSGTLIAQIDGDPADVLIAWHSIGGQITGGSTTAQILFSGTGQYIIQVIDIVSQCMTSDTVAVSEISDIPQSIAVVATDTHCEDAGDGTLTIGAIQGGTAPYIVFVNGVQTSDVLIENLSAGSYFILVEDANGCRTDTLVFVNDGEPVRIDLEPMITLRKGEDFLLEAYVNVPDHVISMVEWSPSTGLSCSNCLSTQAAPTETTQYTVTVTDIYGCSGEASITINVIEGINIFIPNAISPSNNDGINDFFTVFSNKAETQVLSMRIFDRWGGLIFEKRDFPVNMPQEGWDGTFNGQVLNPGVFVYTVEIRTPNGTVEILKGDITLVR